MPLKVGCRVDDPDKHEFDVNFLLYHKGKLYSAGDDGKIKCFAPDLKKIAEVQSNPCSVMCLTANENTLFSCSNEGTIKLFELENLREKSTLVRNEQIEFWKIVFANDCLYSGDNQGNINVWKNEIFYGNVNIAEPVKDLAVFNNLVFTVKDLDLVITEVKLGGEKLQYGTKNSFMGRAPVTTIGDKYFAFASREALDILINENCVETKFKNITKIQGAHEKIINALAASFWNDHYVIYSGGWDKIVKKWIIENGEAKLDGSCDVDIVINAITLGEQGEIYVGGGDGHIVRIEID